MSKTRNLETGSGVSQQLAQKRRDTLSDLSYALRLKLPSSPDLPARGHVRISFQLNAAEWPAIDFAPSRHDAESRAAIERVCLAGRECSYELQHGHLSITGPEPAPGPQQIDVEFVAGTTGLVRREGLVYSLFVPARAHHVFPCFDQPDLKASVELELEIATSWNAIANTPELARSSDGNRLRVQFAPTEPLPTYLFAFVAGELQVEAHRIRNRSFRVCCPRAASSELAGDLDSILELHCQALDFLEQYTGMPYPFSQLGLALIPDFEFAGMEHPGATLYRQNLLLLPPESGTADRVRRAELIAHETAHMWFGNFVTMKWFDDVWLKEVFANFMADKIVAAEFPNTNRALGFMLRHLPPAYAIDRTEGAHAIRQALANLAEAGELYDALIYHKAPIAMEHLERAIGPISMQSALRNYLERFRFANADWPELAACLQQETRYDIASFSREWIESTGRPQLEGQLPFDAAPVYGLVHLDKDGRQRALAILQAAAEPLTRATAWTALFEDMLEGGVEPARLLTAAIGLLSAESDELLIARVLDDLHETYWRFLRPPQRALAAGPMERLLRQHCFSPSATAASESGSRLYWLGQLARFALGDAAIAELESIWRGDLPEFSSLPESLAARLSLTVALHRRDRSEDILREQIRRTRQSDRRQRLEFLIPAVNPDQRVRNRFFEQLIAGQGRGPWAVAGAKLLNHALYADDAVAYLEPGLRFASELRQRGDIFLPRQWLNSIFSGHASAAAAASVRAHLDGADLPLRLRQLILQTADPVFRAARLGS
jgi:aminopeptidase N